MWASVDAVFTLVSIVLTAFTLFFSFRNWRNNKKQKKMNLEKIYIKFYIKKLKKEITIKPYLIRKFFSRQEIQGILANQLIKGVSRYDIDYISHDKYFSDTYKIQTSTKSELIITIEDDEIGQFADTIVMQITDEEAIKIKKTIIDFVKIDDGKPKKKLKNTTLKKLNDLHTTDI
jgi:NADH:ubiquinone oxidoreductase subunit 5 (subunit L)/multisubunit Na+/H+ antiporter MnhA subunit